MNTPAEIVGLFLHTPEAPPERGRLTLLRALGIEGDRHARAMSPRQILVTRAEDAAQFGIAPGQLLENVTVRGLDEAAFVPGAVLRLGASARLRLTFRCEPCGRVAHLVQPLSRLRGRRGLLAVVLDGGEIALGDPVTVEPERLPPLSDIPFERFLAFVERIPPGRVTTYSEIVKGIGVARAYLRALPGYVRRATPTGAPVHRIVDSAGALLPALGAAQATLLAAEGVEVGAEGTVDVARYLWVDAELYLR